MLKAASYHIMLRSIRVPFEGSIAHRCVNIDHIVRMRPHIERVQRHKVYQLANRRYTVRFPQYLRIDRAKEEDLPARTPQGGLQIG